MPREDLLKVTASSSRLDLSWGGGLRAGTTPHGAAGVPLVRCTSLWLYGGNANVFPRRKRCDANQGAAGQGEALLRQFSMPNLDAAGQAVKDALSEAFARGLAWIARLWPMNHGFAR